MIKPGHIHLPDSDDQLLSECRVDTFRSGGKGGQHANKTESAVRLVHLSSGLTVTCQEERSQYLNRQKCLKRLRELIKRHNYRPPKRKSTRPPGWVYEEKKKQKKIRSAKKLLRKNIQSELD